jgi:nucleoside-diphosphate-sugar epimerase
MMQFRLLVESKQEGVFHAVSEEGVPMKEFLGVVAKKLGLELKSQTVEEAMPSMGFLAMTLAADKPASSRKTQAVLGWNPSGTGQPGLVEDLEVNYEF